MLRCNCKNSGFAALFAYTLLACHALWVSVHLYQVANGRLNPWHLGGYGMYTTGGKETTVTVYDVTEPYRRPIQLDVRLWDFMRMNYNFQFTCMNVRKAALVSLFQENPRLIGRRLEFVVWETRLMRRPIRLAQAIRNRVSLEWLDEKRFYYRSQLCGELHTDTGVVP